MSRKKGTPKSIGVCRMTATARAKLITKIAEPSTWKGCSVVIT